jgi:hypothetical protein
MEERRGSNNKFILKIRWKRMGCHINNVRVKNNGGKEEWKCWTNYNGRI